MLLYRISGTDTWVDWDVLHNDQGYSTWPCVSMTYKRISPWGTDGGSGYKDSQATPFYFVSGNHGWLQALSMPGVIGLYPSEATPLQMINGAVVSNAVTMEFLNGTWYLIEAEIANERYWLTESMVEELGWEVYEEGTYEFVFVDSTTGRVVHGVEQLDEMVFVEESAYPIVSKYEKTYDSPQTLADGAYIDTVLPYYPTKLYIASCADNTIHVQTWFGLSVSNEGGYVRVTNNTGATVTLNRLAIQSMDATDAEVVEVKDGSDNHAWAFKWDDNGTPYWYIEYHAERTWRDSLGEWSEVPVGPTLPTVTQLTGGYGLISGTMSVPSNDSTPELRAWDGAYFHGSGIEYDSTRRYAITRYSDGTHGLTTPVNIFVVTWIQSGTSPFLMAVKNVSTISQTFYSARVAVCSSSEATVVPVYNSSNVAYNAFKFTASGTDYYYVLDGTQTDWTDDLSSIGYRLPVIGYFSSSGESATGNTSLSYRYWYPLYKAVGGYMEGDQSKTYTPIKAVKADGTVLDVSNGYMQCVLYTGLLNIQFKPVSSISAHHLIFIES